VRGRDIIRRIEACDPEVVCLTEGHADFFQRTGYVICSEPDYGYKAPPSRRKVLLWSKQPWTDVDQVGHNTLPPGRFVAGRTMTGAGAARFVGVCIPWRDAHFRTGRRDRVQWEDHIAYLGGFRAFLEATPIDDLIVIGDFNQTIPRTRAPKTVWNALSSILKLGLTPVTSGLKHSERHTIDHVMVGPGLAAFGVTPVTAATASGVRRQRFGIKIQLSRAAACPCAGENLGSSP
jgi:hypothetical protein